jgi:hypothetical protein
MSKIKIDANKYSNYSLRDKNLKFALLSAPKHGSKQVCGLSSCRDYLHDVIRVTVHSNDTKGRAWAAYTTRRVGDTSVVDLSRLRLILASNNETPNGLRTQDTLFVGKHMLNIYEEFVGFPKSTITTVDYPVIDADVGECSVWILNGTRAWIKSPHLLSIVTLILRAAYRLKALPTFKNNSMQEVADILKEIACYRTIDTDAVYVSKVGSALPILLAHHDELFTHTMSEAYDKGVDMFHSRGGIVSLCESNSPLKDLNVKVKTLLAGGNI